MTDITTEAVLVHGDRRGARSGAALHALAFLARYRVAPTCNAYGLSLRQWFRWCEDNGICPLEAKRAEIEIFARELEATGPGLSTVASKLNALAGYYRYAVIDGVTGTSTPPAEGARRPGRGLRGGLGLDLGIVYLPPPHTPGDLETIAEVVAGV